MRLLISLILCIAALAASAQNSPESIEMADTMRSNGKIYVVVAVLCIIFTGIAVYLVSIDRKLGRLEKQAGNEKED